MTLDEVEEEIRAALARLGRGAPEFRFDRTAFGDGTPHVEGDGPEFDWVVSERGQEYERRRVDGTELLFIALEGITRRMVQDAELRSRTSLPRSAVQRAMGRPVRDNYSRQTWMEGHARLMGHLRPHWEARVRAHNDALLRRFPLTADEVTHARRLDLSEFGLD